MTANIYTIVLLRHGESVWNRENRFTGWTDVPLSEKGIAEARAAGKTLKAEGYLFDLAYTSVLRRAIQTLRLVLEELGLTEIPVRQSWRLNERHYGTLQGLDKAETARRHGEEQVLRWRRSYDLKPPALSPKDERFPGHDPLYADVPRDELPLTESLKDTVERFLPCWHHDIAPQIKLGRRLIISAHGNSLRALVKYLDDISDEDIVRLNIPTGIPLVYQLDEALCPIRHQYLAAPEAVERAIRAVADQGKSH